MDISGLRVAVTGGAGFIGSHLVDLLVERGGDVLVIDDFSVGSMENLERSAGRIDVRVNDIADASALQGAFAGVDVVFHLACCNLRESISDPLLSERVNALGTLHVLHEAANAGVQRFVHVSSSEVYGSASGALITEQDALAPTTPYGASKLAGEMYAWTFHETYGMPTMVVRPFNAFGPREHATGTSAEVIPRFVRWALTGEPLRVFGDGLQTRDFTWVGDTVRGILAAAECDSMVGERVNIARGHEVSILEVAHVVGAALGVRPHIEFLPARPGDIRRHLASTQKARQLLGFEAEVAFEDGMRRYVTWVREQHGADTARLDESEVINWTTPVPISGAVALPSPEAVASLASP
ncbi:MAG: GDP-mannose 4,6-dehydratase [Dehalococcoidia bacterium]